MALRGDIGLKIDRLRCFHQGLDLVERGSGEQVITNSSQTVWLKYGKPEFAPDGCPLTILPVERQLGDFAVCTACPHAFVDYEGGGLYDC